MLAYSLLLTSFLASDLADFGIVAVFRNSLHTNAGNPSPRLLNVRRAQGVCDMFVL